jgi:S-adenosyl methyltransferase
MVGDAVPPIDTSKPNIARVYDYWLGGKDNFEADRVLAETIRTLDPGIKERARTNRAFVTGAARRAAVDAGIDCFLDLGAGLPTHPAVHEAARDVIQGARVAYIDYDRIVVKHAEALLAKGAGLSAGIGDLRDPDAVLASDAVTSVLDLSRPCGVILGGVFQFLPAEEAAAVVRGYATRVAPGSWIVVSVVHYTDEDLLAAVRARYTAGPLHNHTADDMKRFLQGLDVVPPGITEAQRWLAGITAPCPAQPGYILAGAGIT